MSTTSEVARLKRDIEALEQAVALDLSPRSKTVMTPSERRMLKSDIQNCMQALDELATRLTP